ncbi:hypothetical protein SCHPADRAFT_946847 [Schizopora paradoxa]|uniref:Uncharacterized protein n=1 Tax=Schizopora paradoxa TaxID=27342 RepID=A0A0H2R2F1_9AGAM|nr:hypothetical protein SCHPADRAFT_946847 [Schizopora paradoxa]
MTHGVFGFQGPSLPPFETLLIRGPYPPSAPIHLSISHLKTLENDDEVVASRRTSGVVMLSPNRQAFTSTLEDFNDGWLTSNAMTGNYASLLSKVNIYYPPTPTHWMLLLSLMKPLSKAPHPLKHGLLKTAPSLLILHEPSTYFLEAGSSSGLLSHYLQLITSALATASFLSACEPSMKSIPVVLFDSRLAQLKMPIVRRVDSPRRRRSSSSDSRASKDEGVRNDRVSTFVEKYFQWVGNVSGEEAPASSNAPPPSTFDESGSGSGRGVGAYEMILQNRREASGGAIIWKWTESKQNKKSSTWRSETEFEWHSQ